MTAASSALKSDTQPIVSLVDDEVSNGMIIKSDQSAVGQKKNS